MVTESVIDVADLSVNFKEKSTNYVEDYIVIEKAQMFKIMHSPLFLIRGLSVRDGEWVKRKPFCYANRISRCTILSLSLSLSFVFYKSDSLSLSLSLSLPLSLSLSLSLACLLQKW